MNYDLKRLLHVNLPNAFIITVSFITHNKPAKQVCYFPNLEKKWKPRKSQVTRSKDTKLVVGEPVATQDLPITLRGFVTKGKIYNHSILFIYSEILSHWGSGGWVVKEFACRCRRHGFHPWSEKQLTLYIKKEKQNKKKF